MTSANLRPFVVAVVLSVSVLSALCPGDQVLDISAFSSNVIPRDDVADALNAIAVLAPEKAAQEVPRLREAVPGLPPAGRNAVNLMVAVTLELSGETKAALEAYGRLTEPALTTSYLAAQAEIAAAREAPPAAPIASAPSSPGPAPRGTRPAKPAAPAAPTSVALYSLSRNELEDLAAYDATASFRIKVLELHDGKARKAAAFYKTLADEPERQGWFEVSGRWAWDTSRRAAFQAIVDVKADRLSFRFFNYLASLSIFPRRYNWLFVLLALTVGTRLATLPLLVRSIRTWLTLKRLQPRIDEIKSAFAFDQQAAGVAILNLYRSEGVKLAPGCVLSVLDLVFVIWALVIMGAYSAQMSLDEATLPLIGDVTRFSWLGTIAWAAITCFFAVSAGKKTPGYQAEHIVTGQVILFAIIVVVAWFWQWPIYAFVFWLLLTLASDVARRIVFAMSALFRG